MSLVEQEYSRRPAPVPALGRKKKIAVSAVPRSCSRVCVKGHEMGRGHISGWQAVGRAKRSLTVARRTVFRALFFYLKNKSIMMESPRHATCWLVKQSGQPAESALAPPSYSIEGITYSGPMF